MMSDLVHAEKSTFIPLALAKLFHLFLCVLQCSQPSSAASSRAAAVGEIARKRNNIASKLGMTVECSRD